MRVNEYTKLIGQKAILVPYKKHHVAKYHRWMEVSDENLRFLTASEQLSLDEEYKMQESWRNDDDKCTFVILSRELVDGGADEIASMIGDVNMFVNGDTAELTVMIAESEWRRRGLGREAIQMMLKYGYEVIGIRVFEAKIEEHNRVSLALFESLGFVVTARRAVFHDYALLICAEGILKNIAEVQVTTEKYEASEET